jgi:hypothetical protein
MGGGTYCVQGSTLHLISTSDGGTFTMGDVVATKQ